MKYLALAVVVAALAFTGCAPSRNDLRDDAVTKFDLGKTDEAKVSLNRLLHHYPGDPEGFYWMGRVDQAQGNYPQAIFNYRQCLDADPSFEPARRYLAKAQEQSGITRAERFDIVP